VSQRDRIVLGVLAALGALLAGWFLLIQPKRTQASDLGNQISSVQSQLDTARSEVAAGQAARRAFAGSYTVLARLGEAVPSDDNVPSLIYQISAAASKSHVQFNSLTLTGNSSPAPAPAPSSGSGSTSGSSGSVTAAAAPQTLPPGVSVGPAGFPIEPFSFTFTGNFFHLSDFFGRLERFVVANNNNIAVSGRLMTLDAISLAPGPNGFPNISATVSATTYLLPAGQGLTAGATPLGPGAQTVSTSGHSSSSSGAPTAAVTPPVR